MKVVDEEYLHIIECAVLVCLICHIVWTATLVQTRCDRLTKFRTTRSPVVQKTLDFLGLRATRFQPCLAPQLDVAFRKYSHAALL